MSRKQIVAAEPSSALHLPQEMLDAIGVESGSEVDVAIIDGTLVVRSIEEAERARKIEAATADVFERRASAFAELAEGAS